MTSNEDKMRKLIEDSGLEGLDGPIKRIVKFVPELSCGWEECPEGFHRFIVHSDPETGIPVAISMCIQEDGEPNEQIAISIGDAVDMVRVVSDLLGPLILLAELLDGPPKD